MSAIEFGLAGDAQAHLPRVPERVDMLRWLSVGLCAAATPFVLLKRLRRKWSTGRDLERLDRHVLADIGLVQADVVAAVNGQSPAHAIAANNNELCPYSGHGGVA